LAKKQHKKHISNPAWWFTPVISTLGRWRQKDCKFQTSLGYVMRHCLLKKKKKKGKLGPGMVVHICNPSCSGGRNGKIAVGGTVSGKKVSKNSFQSIKWE
jgi:hypothetical protein